MLCNELLNNIKNNFSPIQSSIEDLSQYDHYWGYPSIQNYKKREKRIDKYLKLIIKFKYKDFKKEDFNHHIKMNGGKDIYFDYEYFFLMIYEDNGKIINIREIGYIPLSLSNFIETILPIDEKEINKYGFDDF